MKTKTINSLLSLSGAVHNELWQEQGGWGTVTVQEGCTTISQHLETRINVESRPIWQLIF